MSTAELFIRDKVEKDLRGALRDYVDSDLFDKAAQTIPGTPADLAHARGMERLRQVALTALAADDIGQIAEAGSECFPSILGNAQLTATNPKAWVIAARYADAMHALAAYNHQEKIFNEHVWRAADPVNDEAIAFIKKAGGYAGLMSNPSLQVSLQDFLDHVYQNRFYAVRNELRTRGWGGPDQAPVLTANKDGIEWSMRVVPTLVGAGGNVTGLEYLVWRGHQPRRFRDKEPADAVLCVTDGTTVVRIADHMAIEASDMARLIVERAGVLFNYADCLLVREAGDGLNFSGLELAVPESDPYADGVRDSLKAVSTALHARGIDLAVINDVMDEAVDHYIHCGLAAESDGPRPH